MNNRRSFITGIKSTKLNKQEINFLKKYKPWGVILFSRNLDNFDQIKKLTSKIKKIFKDNNYPIMIDQEGGRVNRLYKLISLENLTSEYFGKIFIKENYPQISINVSKNIEISDDSSVSIQTDGLFGKKFLLIERFVK